MGSLAAWRLGSALQNSVNKGYSLTIYGQYLPRIHQINTNGITLINIDGEPSTVQVPATQEIPGEQCVDIAMVFNKTYQLTRVAGEIKQCLRPNGLALCFQNGLGSTKLVQNANPQADTVSCTLFEGVVINDQGTVLHKGKGPTWLGMTHHQQDKHANFISLLASSGFELKISPDIGPIQWQKLAINAAVNPLTALTNVKNRQVVEQPLLRGIAEATVREVARVAAALNIPGHSHYVESMLKVALETGENTSSMLIDVRQGRETEIEFINGSVCLLGRQNGIPTPVNQMLLDLVVNYAGSAMPLHALEQAWRKADPQQT